MICWKVVFGSSEAFVYKIAITDPMDSEISKQ